MSQKFDKEEKLEEELENEAREEATTFVDQENLIEEKDAEIEGDIKEIAKLKDMLARTQADYENFKRRVDRDKEDMIFFLKSDIFGKILPRVDDLERVVNSTPEELRGNVLFTGVETTLKSFLKDLEKLGVQSFDSKGERVNPDKHDVMTQVPGEEGVIIDEFVKGYALGDRVLRHAKVVVGSGQ